MHGRVVLTEPLSGRTAPGASDPHEVDLMVRSHPARSQEGIRWFIPACFFLSGASGLVYEVLWTRMLVEIIGGAPYSVSIILTVFMGGLGAGSFWAGRLVDRVPPARLVSIYGTLELVIAGSAGLIPWVLTAVRPLQALLYDRLYDYALAYHVLTFGVCALVLCLPVLCMGATLPILCRYGVHELAHLGRRTGRLYGLNTLGAAVGTLVCGFYLIERWGMDGALWAAVAVNAAIGLACILLGTRQSRSAAMRPRAARPGPETPPEPDAGDRARRAALVIFAVSGFCAMSCEVLWTKLLALIVGPTTFSFTIVLVTFIGGLALGSILFGALADRVRDRLALLVCTQAAGGILLLVVSHVLGNTQLFFAKLIFTFKDQFALLNGLKAAALFGGMILPTLCFGASFPLVGRICSRSVAQVGRTIGSAYMVNTVGSLLGPFLAGFVFLPLLGKEASLRLIAALQLTTCIAVVVLLHGRSPSRRAMRSAGAAALIGLLLCLQYPAWSRRELSVGKYQRFEELRPLMTRTGWVESLTHGTRLLESAHKGEILYYGDGVGGFTTVMQFPDAFGNINVSLANTGKTDASSRQDMQTQVLLAHLPLRHHPRPQRVMVIGLASGITAGEVLGYPVEQLDVLEINPQVVAGSRWFTAWNGGVLSDPRTRLILQDARAHLQLTDRTYDVIISEPSNPWMEGLAALFTREVFASARNRLAEGGVFAQWIHAYQMDWDTFAMIGRGFAQVFPDSLLATMSPAQSEGDYLLIGFKGRAPIRDEAPAGPVASRNAVLSDPRLLDRLIVSEDLAALFGPGVLHTDRNPHLEFTAPRLMHLKSAQVYDRIRSALPAGLSARTRDALAHMDRDAGARLAFAEFAFSVYNPFRDMVDLERVDPVQRERYTALWQGYCAENEVDYTLVNPELRAACAAVQAERLEQRLDRLPDRAASLSYLGDVYMLQSRISKGVAAFQQAVRSNPLSVTAHLQLGLALMRQGRPVEAVDALQAARRMDRADPIVAYHCGTALAAADRPAEAASAFQDALRLDPVYAEAQHRLGLVRAAQGRLPEAQGYLAEAVRLKPGLIEARNDLGVVYARQGRFEDAARQFEAALRLRPQDAEIHTNLGRALLGAGKPGEAIEQFRLALDVNPDDAAAREHLQEAMARRASP
jgi:spermidine synthase